MDRRLMCYVLGVASVLLGLTLADINVHPQDVTGEPSDDLIIHCTVDSSSDVVTWREFITNSEGNKIYTTNAIPIQDTNKYEIVADSPEDLMVKSIGLTDGGKYSCEHISETTPNIAQMVVLRTPDISMTSTLEEHIETNFSCRCFYAADFNDNLQVSHIPRIRVFKDSEAMDIAATRHEERGPGESSNVEAIINYTPLGADDEKTITCVTYTEDPIFETAVNTTLNIRYSVRELNIAPKNTVYFVGETINCTAKGNPDPTFVWSDLIGGTSQQTHILMITTSMLGDNEWECAASQLDFPDDTQSDTISFVVEENPEGDLESSTSGSSSAAIAVGVVLGLLVIGGVVAGLIYIWYRRRNDSDGATSSGYNDTKQTAPKSSSYGGGGQVNMATEPSYPSETVPTGYPGNSGPPTPTHVGQDSPGFGDLGIKHINPNPNVSWDDGLEDTITRPTYNNQVYSPSPNGSLQGYSDTGRAHNMAGYNETGPPPNMAGYPAQLGGTSV